MVRVQQVVVGTMVVHCALCLLSVRADLEDPAGKSVTEDIAFAGRALTKAAMLIPLLIGISVRLAALVPTFFMGVIGIFIFVAFSKKALIISLFALLISYLDKHKNSRPKIFHIHSEGHHHPEMDAFEFEPHHHPPHKFFDFPPPKKHFRKWPKSDHGGSWSLTGSSMDLMDSYLPQPTRRNGARPASESSRKGYYVPRYVWVNTTESNNTMNNTGGITPELQQFIDKTLLEDDDPR